MSSSSSCPRSFVGLMEARCHSPHWDVGRVLLAKTSANWTMTAVMASKKNTPALLMRTISETKNKSGLAETALHFQLPQVSVNIRGGYSKKTGREEPWTYLSTRSPLVRACCGIMIEPCSGGRQFDDNTAFAKACFIKPSLDMFELN